MRLSIISLLFFTLLSFGTEDLKIELDQKLESLMPKVIGGVMTYINTLSLLIGSFGHQKKLQTILKVLV